MVSTIWLLIQWLRVGKQEKLVNTVETILLDFYIINYQQYIHGTTDVLQFLLTNFTTIPPYHQHGIYSSGVASLKANHWKSSERIRHISTVAYVCRISPACGDACERLHSNNFNYPVGKATICGDVHVRSSTREEVDIALGTQAAGSQ